MDAQMTARLQKAHPGLGLAAQLAGAALLLALLLTSECGWLTYWAPAARRCRPGLCVLAASRRPPAPHPPA